MISHTNRKNTERVATIEFISARRGIWNNAGTRFDYDSSSSSLIPAYGKRVRRRRRPEIASCGFGFIKDRPAGFGLLDAVILRSCRSSSPVCASVCQSRRCASNAPSLDRARESSLLLGSHESRWRRRARKAPYLIDIPGNSRWSALFYKRLYMIPTNWPLPDFDGKKSWMVSRV